MMAFLIISKAGNVNAQGKGHHKGHHRNEDRHGRSHEWEYDRRNNHACDHDYHHGRGHGHHHGQHEVRRVVHYHDHAPVVVRHYAPRYIYYRDYDVYYDRHNSVYISYSGRNWTVSANLPVVLRRVDVHRAVRMEVDYDHDDFSGYLERNRPSYRRIYTGL